MPFKDDEARRAYMRAYLAEWRAGRRRGDALRAPAARTVKARAAAEKKRKRLWFLQNKAWCADRQRERRRLARQGAEQQLLASVPRAGASSASPRSKSRPASRKQTPTRKAA